MRRKEIREVLLIHSGQRSSSQSGCEHDGGVYGNTGLGTMHNSSRNRFISYLSQCASVPVKPRLYPCQCNSPTYFPRYEQNQGCCQQSLLTIGPVFLSYLSAGRPSWGEKLIWPAADVVMAALLAYPSYSVSFSLSLLLFGWMAVPYWSVLFLSCGFETVPTLWMSDDSLPILDVLGTWTPCGFSWRHRHYL